MSVSVIPSLLVHLMACDLHSVLLSICQRDLLSVKEVPVIVTEDKII